MLTLSALYQINKSNNQKEIDRISKIVSKINLLENEIRDLKTQIFQREQMNLKKN